MEERIFTFKAQTGQNALDTARNLGRESAKRHDIENMDVTFQFVGVIELIQLSASTLYEEVWLETKDGTTRNGSLGHLIPKPTELEAMKK